MLKQLIDRIHRHHVLWQPLDGGADRAVMPSAENGRLMRAGSRKVAYLAAGHPRHKVYRTCGGRGC
jgi:hypothetical protein